MQPVDYEEGQKIIQEECTCICGAGLCLAWGGSWGIKGYVLRCRDDPFHKGIARQATLGPYDIPGFNLFNLRRDRQMEKDYGKEKTTKLMKYEGVVSLTKPEAMEILRTFWPKAPTTEVLKAALICSQYGLNPLMKHVFLIPFKRWQKGVVVGEDWVAVLGIGANRLMAHRGHSYSYLDLTPRIMTEGEQQQILGEVDDKRIWAITKLKDTHTSAEATGIGSWPRDETPYGSEKGNTKLNMACIRSERQALDRLYPGEMPQGVPVMDESYVPPALKEADIEGEFTDLDEEPAPTEPGTGGTAAKVDQKANQSKKKASEAEGKFGAGAGEIGPTGANKVADAANFHEAETSPQKSPAASAPTEPPPYEPKELRNIGDLMHAANERWGLAPSEVEKKLGKSRTQFVDLQAEWNELKTRVEQQSK